MLSEDFWKPELQIGNYKPLDHLFIHSAINSEQEPINNTAKKKLITFL